MENQINTLSPHYLPKPPRLIALSMQHVFAMFSATILVPLLTGLPIGLGLFTSGVGTLLYILCSKRKIPMYLGSSFAYLAYINQTKADYGLGAVLTGVVMIGVIYCLVALIIKFAGTRWLTKLFPPIVIGSIIIIIGLSLSSTAIINSGMKDITSSNLNNHYKAIIVAIMTMLFASLLAIKAKGFAKAIPFLLAIILGYLVALSVNWLPNSPNIIDFSSFNKILANPSKWFSFPEFTFLGHKNQDLILNFKMVKVDFRAVVTVIPITFATICEHIGGHQVLGKITGNDYQKDPGLHRTILGDGVASAFAGLVGSVPNTSYGENIAVIGMTKTASVYVTCGAALFAIFLSFFNLFTSFLLTIPIAVIGGICLILYGFIAANGFKILFDAKVDLTNSRNVIIISVMLVTGLGGASIIGLTSMAIATLLGVILNLVLPYNHEETVN